MSKFFLAEGVAHRHGVVVFSAYDSPAKILAGAVHLNADDGPQTLASDRQVARARTTAGRPCGRTRPARPRRSRHVGWRGRPGQRHQRRGQNEHRVAVRGPAAPQLQQFRRTPPHLPAHIRRDPDLARRRGRGRRGLAKVRHAPPRPCAARKPPSCARSERTERIPTRAANLATNNSLEMEAVGPDGPVALGMPPYEHMIRALRKLAAARYRWRSRCARSCGRLVGWPAPDLHPSRIGALPWPLAGCSESGGGSVLRVVLQGLGSPMWSA